MCMDYSYIPKGSWGKSVFRYKVSFDSWKPILWKNCWCLGASELFVLLPQANVAIHLKERDIVNPVHLKTKSPRRNTLLFINVIFALLGRTEKIDAFPSNSTVIKIDQMKKKIYGQICALQNEKTQILFSKKSIMEKKTWKGMLNQMGSSV